MFVYNDTRKGILGPMTAFTRQYFDETTEKVFEKLEKSCEWSENERQSFYLLAIRLLEENEKYNLTAIRDLEGVIQKHFYDSAAAAVAIPKNASVIDIGSGAGFPSLPLAIIRPDLKITPIDSTEKKVNFIKSTAELLGLTNVNPIFGRAEDLAKTELRDKFSCAIARSVASLPIICELCLPFVRPNGIFVAMKSEIALHEIDEAQNALKQLGASQDVKTDSLYVDDNGDQRMLFVISKESRTSAKYPRNYGQIKKKPL